MLDFAKMIWWLELGCKDGWIPDSVIKLCWEVNTRSVHKEEDSNIFAGSLITWCKPNSDQILFIALPSIVIMSFLHQLLDFA